MHPDDRYEARRSRPAHKHEWVRVSANRATCACGRHLARITLQEWTQAAQIDHWNRAMRTAKSRRKFILTGRVE